MGRAHRDRTVRAVRTSGEGQVRTTGEGHLGALQTSAILTSRS